MEGRGVSESKGGVTGTLVDLGCGRGRVEECVIMYGDFGVRYLSHI